MNFSTNELQRMLQDSALDFARAHGDYERRRKLIASPAGFSEDDWRLMAELGWFAVLLPEAMGGIGGGPVEAMLITEALGQSLATEPFLSTAVLGARAISAHGTSTQQANHLPGLAEGKLRTAFAYYEQGAQQNRYWSQLPLRAAAGGWVLHGDKHMVFDGPSAGLFIVVARSAGAAHERDGLTVLLVPADAPGLTQRDFTRLDGGRACHLSFDQVAIAQESVLGEPGRGAEVIDDLFGWGIAALCGEALGVMQVLHDATLDYLKTRQQFGRPIGSFQALAHRQVDMYAALEQTRSIALAVNMAMADDLPEASRLQSMAKVQLGRAASIIGQGAIQLHGGIGMTEELNVGAYFKRLTVMNAQFGTAEHHLARLAE
ncbi:Flavoprotein desaturase PigA [Pandoraea iniqua]|uniref:acyl-CoA dehydrogenase family protein n=1 Tax=Pandoraea iniqua TaxID=2508288 RepID=UPI001254B89D|nr:acyl-CoA dehydrogenase [Pandoraea iniqua]VVD89318.1 Flavoprotein desaturase PigA [Pandoraea iniqua]